MIDPNVAFYLGWIQAAEPVGAAFCRDVWPKRVARLANRGIKPLLQLGLATLVAGCAHMGPKTVTVDRFDYSTAIADSWKQQTLLNIVKLRYNDLPVFVEVSSIVAGYSMQTGVTAVGTASSSGAVQGDYLSVGGNAIYTDRPTITYTPMTGEKFLRGLITPIDPKNIFSLIQSGYAADFILGLTVESLNGVRNRSAMGGTREADPEFLRVLALLHEIQAAGAFGMRVEEIKPKGTTAVVFFQRGEGGEGIDERSAEIRRLLHLPAEGQKYTLVYSPVRGAEGELAVNSRSMLQIMGAFASYMDVPAEHLQAHWARPGLANPGEQERVMIHSGKDKPTNAYAAARYRDYWFWVDDGDLQAKRALTAVMFFFSLADTGGPDKQPLVTIPAQ